MTVWGWDGGDTVIRPMTQAEFERYIDSGDRPANTTLPGPHTHAAAVIALIERGVLPESHRPHYMVGLA